MTRPPSYGLGAARARRNRGRTRGRGPGGTGLAELRGVPGTSDTRQMAADVDRGGPYGEYDFRHGWHWHDTVGAIGCHVQPLVPVLFAESTREDGTR